MTPPADTAVPELLTSRLMEVRRQQISALHQAEQVLIGLGVLAAEDRVLLSQEERAAFRSWLRLYRRDITTEQQILDGRSTGVL